MSEAIRVGIIGGGWPGRAHARGYAAAGGFKVVAVSDLIPERRKAMVDEFKLAKEFADAADLIEDKDIDAVSVCLPNHLHASVAVAAMRAGKHVVIESPPATTAKEARQVEASAQKNGRVALYAMQRRFGGAEQAARQAIAKGYTGSPYHARASWTRTRGIPIGTGWYTDRSRSGGGALIDLGTHLLDLAWSLLSQPKPVSAFGISHRRLQELMPQQGAADVEEAAFALVKFEGGQSLELAASWSLNQPAQQNGTACRIYGDQGAVDVYTRAGTVLHRGFTPKGESKATPLKLPKTVGHVAMMRHFRECIQGTAQPLIGAAAGVTLMQMIEAIYKSAETGRAVGI